MTQIVTLSASLGNSEAVPDNGGFRLPIAEVPAEVTFSVTLAEEAKASDVTFLRDGIAIALTGLLPTDPNTGKEITGTLSVTTSAEYGTYTANVAGVTSANLEIEAAHTDDQGDDDEQAGAVTEIEPGELDRAFWISTGMPVGLLSVGVAVGVAILVGTIDLQNELKEHDRDEWTSGGGAETVAGLVQLLSVAIGTVMLLIGSWLAALEARGQLRQKIKTRVSSEVLAERGLTDATSSGVVAQSGEAIAKVIGALKGARGTIAVLSVGGMLLIGALLASTVVANGSHGPSPTPTPTPSSAAPTTGAGSSTPTPEPSIPPAGQNSPPSPTPSGN